MGGEAAELVVVREQVDAGGPAVVLLAGEDERHGESPARWWALR
jgi:hypothetical protein